MNHFSLFFKKLFLRTTLFFVLALGAGFSSNAQTEESSKLPATDKTGSSFSDCVTKDAALLDIPAGYLKNARWYLPLKKNGKHGSTITWSSSNTEYIDHDGRLLKLSPQGKKNVTVQMKATITKGKAKKNKTFLVRIAHPEPQYAGYLFTYFEGTGVRTLEEQLRFGISTDAIHWHALNNNQPVIASDSISKTGGIRDPHILRGEDGKTFYMVATDMFVAKDGWGSNPGLVLMKSDNLIDWSHSYVDFRTDFPENFGNAHWVWAPQTIYDPSAGKYMVYFTLRREGGNELTIYYAYANSDFSAFESEPQVLFNARFGCIDNDIIYKDGIWHMFYKGNTKDEKEKEIKNGIQQATCETLHGEWKEDFIYLDVYAGKTPVEGSGVFKLNNSDKYVLMYDLYTSKRYEYQTSKDLYDFGTTSQSFTKNFHPRHGTVISITQDEMDNLTKKWGTSE